MALAATLLLPVWTGFLATSSEKASSFGGAVGPDWLRPWLIPGLEEKVVLLPPSAMSPLNGSPPLPRPA